MDEHEQFEAWLDTLSEDESAAVALEIALIADAMGVVGTCREHVPHPHQERIDAAFAELMQGVDL